VVPSCQSRFTFLAAGRVSAAADLPTRSPKTRVGVFRRRPSGRLSRRGRCRPIITPGLRACGYKTASGLGKWPNQDPLGDIVFVQRFSPKHIAVLSLKRRLPPIEAVLRPNLYEFVRNDSVDKNDEYGLCCDQSSLTKCKWSCLGLGILCGAACTAATEGWGTFWCVSACAALEHGCENDCDKEWCK
jgi:hypothetical protein